MANENKITLKMEALTSNNKIEPANDLDPIASMYPRTMISEDICKTAAKAALNKLYGISDKVTNEEKRKTPEEEYIWVKGYKGTDKDMRCRDYQYEVGQKFDMPEDATIDVCHSGFHLCPELKQVFSYYSVGMGNRFFKVSALVPKSQTKSKTINMFAYTYNDKPDKYAAKSIIFLSECTPDEILNAAYDNSKLEGLTDDEKKEVLATSLGEVRKRKVTAELVALGYSEDIAKLAFENDREYLARALVKQTNISWDTRILALITSILDD